MTEILTESFCERCGTRYTFESVAPRGRRLGRMRVLGSGLKNFVMSDGTSLDEAMAEARSDAERQVTTQQLDAFHRTFNFCMSCRQYTCGNCWNAVEARCLSCAPLTVPGAADTAFAGIDAARLLRAVAPEAPAPSHGESELVGVAEAAAAHAEAPVAEIDMPEAEEAAAATLQPYFVVSEAETIGAAEPAEPEPAPEAAAPEGEAEAGVLGLEPGESLEDAIAAYEASLTVETQPAGPGVDIVEQPTWPTPPVTEEAELPAEPVAEPAPIAAVEIAPPAPEPAPIAAVEIAPPAPEPLAPELPVAATPEAPPIVAPAPAAPPPVPTEAPQWPTGPRWPTGVPAHQPVPATLPVADPLTALMARQATEAMWAASSRDVVQPLVAATTQSATAVQPCVSCGISLSARARFCRRCGTSQDG